MTPIRSHYADDACVGRSDTISIASHVQDFGEGPCLFFPANQALSGQMTMSDDREVVTLMLVRPSGAAAPSGVSLAGLCYAMSADEARDFAAALLRSAEELEATAARLAAAALRKAAGK